MQIPDYLKLNNLAERFPKHYTKAQLAKAQTVFLKKISLAIHELYQGKMITIPKAGLYDFGWFGVYYTPGVSSISTAIRDEITKSYSLSNRGNLVAVVSDSTRVLGDGDVSPSGGLGVMEGKSFLMYYLGGMSSISLCIDSHKERHKAGTHDPSWEHDPNKIIDFVQMLSPSVGAVNLEDISQPNCYKVLDDLQDCGIPVWHDDAQGTACVILAGLINATKLANKDLHDAKIVLMGAGASNSTVARLLIKANVPPHNIILFDIHGGLHQNRRDIKEDPRFYRQWELCKTTNPHCIQNIEDALHNADALIALSQPGPNVVKKHWISTMAPRPILFTCANPIPEIYPYEALDAGAYIAATGRSDFPNQVNNSLGFPGILKGTLLAQATQITDNMAIAAAYALANAIKNPATDYILPKMDENHIYPIVAKAVAEQAIKDNIAHTTLTPEEIYAKAQKDIQQNQQILHTLVEKNYIQTPSQEFIDKVLQEVIREIE